MALFPQTCLYVNNGSNHEGCLFFLDFLGVVMVPEKPKEMDKTIKTIINTSGQSILAEKRLILPPGTSD